MYNDTLEAVWLSGNSTTETAAPPTTIADGHAPYAISAVRWPNILLSAIQWSIFVLGTVGNLLVLLVLLWRRSTGQLVTQLFVGSLSVAGLLWMVSSAWVQALQFIDAEWKYGKMSCQIHYYLQISCIFVSVWTLAVVALERFIVEYNSSADA